MGAATRGDDDIEKNLLKMIPDGLIGRFLLNAPFNSPPNRLDDCETFVEFKTLASLAITPNARAQQVQADTEKRAHDLDVKYPGSTSRQVLKMSDMSYWSSVLFPINEPAHFDTSF